MGKGNVLHLSVSHLVRREGVHGAWRRGVHAGETATEAVGTHPTEKIAGGLLASKLTSSWRMQGGARDGHPFLIQYFIFMQFSESWHPSSGKSWIRHCLILYSQEPHKFSHSQKQTDCWHPCGGTLRVPDQSQCLLQDHWENIKLINNLPFEGENK